MSLTQVFNELQRNLIETARTQNLNSEEDATFEGFPDQNSDSLTDSSSSNPPPNTIPVIPRPIPVQEDIMSTVNTAILTHAAKFVGHIDPNDPDKHRLEKYNVDHFLADVESRIASRSITNNIDKIKEALVFVHPDKGDAHSIMISAIFKEVKTWDEFKNKCKSIWKAEEHKDKFFNLEQLRTLTKHGTYSNTMVEVRDAIDRVADDMMVNGNIEKHKGGPRDQLVDLREALTYFSYGTIYALLPDDYRLAFKKIPLDPKNDHLVLLGQIKDKVQELRVRKAEEIAAVTRHTQNIGESTKSPPRVTNKPNSPSGSNRGRGYPNRNTRGTAPQNVGYQANSYSHQRAKGNRFNGSGNRSRMECKKCGRTNHWTNACRMCDCCKRIGHSAADCYYRQGSQNPPQGQGQGSV